MKYIVTVLEIRVIIFLTHKPLFNISRLAFLLNMRQKLSVPDHYYPVFTLVSLDLFHTQFKVNGRHDAISELFIDNR